MPSGLQVWNSDGKIILDTNSRMGRILGAALNVTSNGSVTVPAFSTGTPFWQVVANSLGTSAIPAFPRMVLSGTTLSWDFSAPGTTGDVPPSAGSVNIFYGVA